MIRSQSHSFLTDLDAPLRILIQTKQQPPKTLGVNSTSKTLLHVFVHWARGELPQGSEQGQYQQTLRIHRGAISELSINE